MPELPEVETVRRGISPHVTGQIIRSVVVREHRLRCPVPRDLASRLEGQTIRAVSRRAKYLLFHVGGGGLLLHLGMSGSLRIVPAGRRPEKHDHVDWVLDDDRCLRLRDPRRFGSLHWSPGDPAKHPLLCSLGPEPLSRQCDGDYLYRRARQRRVCIKSFIMDGRILAGVGNIYANEALFAAGIHPLRRAGSLSKERHGRLVRAIKRVLRRAIAQGGTTLRDFTDSQGRPGYFQIELSVYGRAGQPCANCARPLRVQHIGQRSSFYCTRCQR